MCLTRITQEGLRISAGFYLMIEEDTRRFFDDLQTIQNGGFPAGGGLQVIRRVQEPDLDS